MLKFLFFFILCISIFISTAQILKLEWDGFHWILKALVFYNGNDIQDIRYVKSLPEYPHLGGYIWAFFWKNSILQLEYYGRFFYIYFYIVSIFTIFNLLNFKSDKILFLLIFITILITYDPYLFAGYQEYLIFSTLLIAARFIGLIDFNKKDEKNKIFLSIIIMSLLIWFKNEGLIYFLIFGSLLVILNQTTLNFKIYYFTTIFLIILIQYLLKKHVIGIFGSQHDLYMSEFIYLFYNFDLMILKLVTITKHLIIAMIKYPLWLITILLLFLIKIKTINDNLITRYFLYALILNLAIIYLIYLNIDQSSYKFFLRVTLDRLIFQTSGFYLYIFIYFLNKIKFKKINFLK